MSPELNEFLNATFLTEDNIVYCDYIGKLVKSFGKCFR